jgi:DNA-3-methyladenine glycosylase II
MTLSETVVRADPDALETLAREPQMGALIDTFGSYSWPLSPPFRALVRAVVAQLISGAAARATFNRLEAATAIAPERILELSSDELLALGVPRRKGEYLHGLSHYALGGGLTELEGLSDAEVLQKLVALRGIGRWTAEMFLIFALGRPDVWPVGDMGVVRSAERYYGCATLNDIEALGERFRPHCSAAVWYLWRWIEANPKRGSAQP